MTSNDVTDDLLRDWARERPDLDTRAMAVVARIMRLGSECEARAEAALKPCGLNYSDFDVLATLRRSGKPFRLSPTQLCQQVLLSSGAMTACLNRLERIGHVERHRNAADRRGLLVQLSSHGKQLIEEAARVRFAEAERFLGALDEPKRLILAQLLEQLMTDHPRAGIGTPGARTPKNGNDPA